MYDKENQSKFQVRVSPGASRNEIVTYGNGVLKVKIAATPVQGKANKELIAFLAEVLNMRKSRLSILKGETSRDKMLGVDGLSQEQLELKLKSNPYS